MLKEHSFFLQQVIAFIDCVLITVLFYFSYTLVAHYYHLHSSITNYLGVYLGFLAFYLYFGWTRSLFSVLRFNWMDRLIRRTVTIFASATILGAAILYMLPDAFESRRLYLLFTSMCFVVITTEKVLLRTFIRNIRRRGRNTTTILLFGKGRRAAALAKQIRMHPEWGLRIIKTIDLDKSPEVFEDILKRCYVEEVFFIVPRSLSSRGFVMDPYLQICEEIGRPARVFLNLTDATTFARWQYHNFLDTPTLISHTVELDPDQIIFKRMFDICGALVGMTILMVTFPFLSVAIKLSSPGPIFFRQVRVGKNGKRFVIYKFRTMVADAEERKKELMKKNELKGAVFKMKNDPRVTKIGAFMRKFSLDEFPQFINIMRGEMSLVGTRPPTPDEVQSYDKWHHRRISIRPGVTGMWQVSGRNKITDFNQIVSLDLQYIDNWSIWLDIKIIFKTISTVFKGSDAY